MLDGGWLHAEEADGMNDVEDKCSERKGEMIYVCS